MIETSAIIANDTVRVRFRDRSQIVKNEAGKKVHILNVNMTCLELGDYLENLSSKTSPLKLIQIGEGKVIYLSDHTPIRDFICNQSTYAIEKHKAPKKLSFGGGDLSPKKLVENTTESPPPYVEKIVAVEVITEEEEKEEEVVSPILDRGLAVDRLMNKKPSSRIIKTLIKLVANLVKSPNVKKFKKIKVNQLKSTIGDEDLLNAALVIFQIIGFDTRIDEDGFILCEKVNTLEAENILSFLKSPWDMSPEVSILNMTKKKTIEKEWESQAKFYTVRIGSQQYRLTEEQKCNMTIKNFKEFCDIDDSEKICCGEFRELRENQTVNELFDTKTYVKLSIPLRLEMRYVEDDLCPICRDIIEDKGEIATSHDCGHTLHLECAKLALEHSTSCSLCKTEWTGYDIWNPETKELSEQKIKEIKKLEYDGDIPFSVRQVLGEDDINSPFTPAYENFHGNLRCPRGHGLQRLTFSPPCNVCCGRPSRPPLGCHRCRYAVCATCQIQFRDDDPASDFGNASNVDHEDGFFSIMNPGGRIINEDIGAEHRCPRGHILAIFPESFRVPCGVCTQTHYGYVCVDCRYMKCADCYSPSPEIQSRMRNNMEHRDIQRMPSIDLDFPLGRSMLNKTCVCCDRTFVPREADAETEIPICGECFMLNQLLVETQ